MSCHFRTGALAALTLAVAATARAEPAAPEPRAIERIDDVIEQSAALVEGTVSGIDYAYDPEDGPRTLVTLSGVRTHLGTSQGPSVTLRVRGGWLPDGRFLFVPELPSFVHGKTYLVFLRNTSWKWSPIVKDLALRVEDVDGKPVLVHPTGVAVEGVGDRGVVFGKRPLFHGQHEAGPARRAPERVADAAREDVAAAIRPEELVAGVGQAARSRRQALGGRFLEHPARGARWDRTPVLAHGRAATPSGADRAAPTTVPEPDAAR
jgi:hypothetical protein